MNQYFKACMYYVGKGHMFFCKGFRDTYSTPMGLF